MDDKASEALHRRIATYESCIAQGVSEILAIRYGQLITIAEAELTRLERQRGPEQRRAD